jgi:hypothetical protein
MNRKPEVEARVTFLRREEGGRQASPDLSGGHYRPHVVVGDPNQGEAVVGSDGVVAEEYLGVQFTASDQPCEQGSPLVVTLQLIYAPHVGYERLAPGATFTIREGARVVGFGEVLR